MAASGVNIKMGVEGLSQFKNSMKTAQTAVKTLDQQLALNEKQFKATGDAEAYMEQKTELLELKLKEQKAIAENAEKALKDMADKGVDKASDSFQKMQQQLLKAKGDMLDTEAAMNDIGAAGEEAANGADAMNQQLKRIGTGINWQNVTEGLGNITNGLENVAKKALGAAKKVAGVMLGGGSWADDLVTEATAWEIEPEKLYRMQQTARIIDTDVDTILGARKKLTAAMGKESNEQTMGAFAALGIDPTNRHNDIEGVFWDAGRALMDMEDKVNRNEYAMALFGRSFEDLIPLFKSGEDEYNRVMDTWNWIGDENLEKLGKMDDAYQTLESNVESLKLKLISEFAEPFTQLLETIDGKLGELSAWLESEEGKAAVNNVIMTVQQAMEWISKPENINKVIDGVKNIAIGWAAIKLTGGALQLFQLVSGLTGLMSGGAAGALSSALSGVASVAIPVTLAAITCGPLLSRLIRGETPEETQARETSEKLIGLGREARGSNITTPNDRDAFRSVLSWLFTGKTGHESNAGNKAIEEAEERNQRWLANQRALDRMTQTADDLRGVNQGTARSTSELTQAANDLKGLPAATASAVHAELAGMNVYLDGEAVGRIVTPRVGSNMAGQVMAMIK